MCCSVWHHILLLLLYWTLGTTGAVCARALPLGLQEHTLCARALWNRLLLTVTFAALGTAGAHSLCTRALFPWDCLSSRARDTTMGQKVTRALSFLGTVTACKLSPALSALGVLFVCGEQLS